MHSICYFSHNLFQDISEFWSYCVNNDDDENYRNASTVIIILHPNNLPLMYVQLKLHKLSSWFYFISSLELKNSVEKQNNGELHSEIVSYGKLKP